VRLLLVQPPLVSVLHGGGGERGSGAGWRCADSRQPPVHEALEMVRVGPNAAVG